MRKEARKKDNQSLNVLSHRLSTKGVSKRERDAESEIEGRIEKQNNIDTQKERTREILKCRNNNDSFQFNSSKKNLSKLKFSTKQDYSKEDPLYLFRFHDFCH